MANSLEGTQKSIDMQRASLLGGKYFPDGSSDLYERIYIDNYRDYSVFQKYTDCKVRCGTAVAEYIRSSGDDLPTRKTLRMLDVGCGGGELTWLVASKLCQRLTKEISVVGVDPSGPLIRNAKRRFRNGREFSPVKASFIEGALCNDEDRVLFTKGRDSFGFVLCSYVLYWLSDWLRAVDELIEQASVGGLVCCVLLSNASPDWLIREELFRNAVERFEIDRMESSEDLQVVLNEANIPFFVQRIGYSITIPENLIDKASVIRFLSRGTPPEELVSSLEPGLELRCYQDLIWIKKMGVNLTL